MDCSPPSSFVHGFPGLEYSRGLAFPSPGALADPGIGPTSLALAGGFFTAEPPGKPDTATTASLCLQDCVWVLYACAQQQTFIEYLLCQALFRTPYIYYHPHKNVGDRCHNLLHLETRKQKYRELQGLVPGPATGK